MEPSRAAEPVNTDNVVRLPTASAGPWLDMEVRLPPPRPRIAPGRYQARSAALEMRDAFGRKTLELGFDVFAGEATDGGILARVPFFVPTPGKRGLSPQSKLARMLYLVGIQPTRWTRVNLVVLRDKLWAVDVADAQKDAAGTPLTVDGGAYSVIARVIARLA